MNINQLLKYGRVNEARNLHDTGDGFYASADAQENFQHQNSFGPHHAFDNCGSDWKSYFLNHDALHNTADDVVFSIFDKYLCELRCPTCYLNKQWMTRDQLAPFVPEMTPEIEDRILGVFSHFYRVGSIDDLRMVKTHYPALFGFYTRNAPMMEHNITDNGFFAQYDILMNDCHFAKTAYLSFSDYVLDKNDGKVVDRLIPMITALHERSPIRKINFILSKGMATDNPNVLRLFEWVVKNTNIETFFHTDLCVDNDHVADLKVQYGYDLPSIYYQENAYDPPIVCQILTETVQLRGTQFYTTLTGSTLLDGDERITKPFYDFKHGWNVADFLSGLLAGKVRTYDYYRDIMRQREGNRYWEYFSWCADHVVVNHDYSYIPAMMIKPWTKMAAELSNSGFVNTYAGYIKKDQAPVPLVGFS